MTRNILEAGTLKKYDEYGYTELPYEIGQLTAEDLDAVAKVLQFATQTNQAQFLARPPVQIQQILAQNCSFGLFCENDLIGIRLSGYPTLETLYLLDNLPISFEDSQRHARLTGLVILPPYRKQKFGSYLTKINLEHLANQGRDIVWMLISPFNYPSLKLFLKLDFKIYKLVKLSHNRERFLLKFETSIEPLAMTEIKLAHFQNIALQTELIESGWVGYAVTENPLDFNVMYGRGMLCDRN
ncbi:MAG: GNAT family N-acetyltransferase [Jaaginema sp. PMC 1079.18]|nr:GNAT family N-acetyltransferase [Jaaginema sp. PMC 1080.18]MEC4851040.1 GNAT family N-acetyltransferase [Jaaginema sp. PMC 1079.18]MEC4866445.1 GNAT family N-acetyltransferase [Jaaginema sp. PMC 1078.18]